MRLPLELHFDRLHLFRCRVPILIVTDSGSGGFGKTDGFHLGHVLDALASDPWSHVEFVITKAHRQNSMEAGVIDGFRFDTHDLSAYSQVWLFGIERNLDPLSAAELAALSRFMDQGGGVFATGDHENLGRPLAAEVPRVRSMRRWHWPSPGPAGEPVAPDQTGTGRHDTVMDTQPIAGLQGSQSDKVPQPIRPKWYSRTIGKGWVRRAVRYPHPVLCGPDGVIEYLPDHMHEGLCEVPSDLGRSFTFAGYTTTEYPTTDGHQEHPEVIAHATTRNTTGAEFGVLGAYDGHRVGVGRVVVDATWHHWFNINLVGFVNATDPAHPSYDAAVVPKWDAIKAYFRNVGVWLARPSLQRCLRNGSWLLVTKYLDILISRQKLDLVTDRVGYFLQLGTFAVDALGRLASRCQRTRWIIDLLEWPIWRLDPWYRPPRPMPDPPPWLDLDLLELVSLGAAIEELAQRFERDRDLLDVGDKRAAEVEQVAKRGAAAGALLLLKQMAEAGPAAARLQDLASQSSRR